MKAQKTCIYTYICLMVIDMCKYLLIFCLLTKNYSEKKVLNENAQDHA